MIFKVDLRYAKSFEKDPDLQINVRLVNILIYTVSKIFNLIIGGVTTSTKSK